MVAAGPAAAQEDIFFPAIDKTPSARSVLLKKITDEQVRIDVGIWILGEHEISQKLVARHLAGLPVRILGDRASIFEGGDSNTRREFEYLASNGVPIRLRYHPRDFPEIIHWKAGIFVGQNVVEFGSANWTFYELEPWSATDFKDETALFTNDSTIVQAFKTKFDQYWADTTYFLDWPTAYKVETGQTWPTPMSISRQRLEPDIDTNIPGMVWSQGSALNARMMAEMDAETQRIDMVFYRLTMPEIADKLIEKHRQGVQVRVFAEPTQYRNPGFPEYWLVGAMVDKLLVAGVPVKQRTHQGLTHMKTLITSRYALNASGNFTRFWERDHNYFISADGKPALYWEFRQRFEDMWNDAGNYTWFQPQAPNAPALVAPGNGWVNVATVPQLEWKRAPFATSFDVYIGTSLSNMSPVGRVNAQVDEYPPETYSFIPSQALLPNTTYYWKVVSRTYMTPNKPSLVASSSVRTFTTGGSGGGGGGGGGGTTPFNGTPASLPGVVQAENFDEGAAGAAYSDTTGGNSGGMYRQTDVDIESSSDTGGGYNVGWVKVGEWLKYTVNVTAAGTYNLELRLAGSSGGGTLHLEVDGVDKTGPISVPATGGWQSWTTVTKTGISLAAGTQTWRLVFDSPSSGTTSVANVNYIRIAVPGGGGGNGSTPYGGTPASLPGTVEAENFDEGGAGIAYRDLTTGNAGGQYRSTDMDIGVATDTGGGYRLGWLDPGEWLNYTVDVSAAGTYDVEVRVAASGGGGTFHIEAGGVNKTGPMTIPNTGGWQAWTTIRASGISFSSGRQVLRLVIDATGASGAVGNINWIRLATGGGGGGNNGSAPFGGIALTLPGTIEAENFDAGSAGVAYHDTTAGNTGGAYRSTNVDIGAATDTGGGYRLGWVDAGEWLNYTVNVEAAGTYAIDVRVASNGAGGTFHLEVNGTDVTGPMSVPNTGGWQAWTTIRRTGVSLAAGPQVFRLVMDDNGSTGAIGNINWVRVVTP